MCIRFDSRRNHSTRQLGSAAALVIEPLEGRRLLFAGQLDAAFGSAGSVLAPAGATKQVNDMVVLGDGRILTAGTGSGGSLGLDFTVARYTVSGQLDLTFGGGDGIAHTDFFGRDDVARSIVTLTGGKFLVGGTTNDGSGPLMVVARYHADGSLDTTFGVAGRASVRVSANDSFADLAVRPDGRIVVVGDCARASGRDVAVLRFTAAGLRDTTFGGGDGVVTVDPMGALGFQPEDDAARSVVLQSAGRIVILSGRLTGYGWNLIGLTPNGVHDVTFGDGNGIYTRSDMWRDHEGDVVLAADDSIFVAATSDNYYRPFFGIFKVRADGTTASEWGPEDGGDWRPLFDADYAWGLNVALQSDGKILQSGCINGMFAVVRYDPADGALDTTFGAGGIASLSLGGTTDMPDAAYAMALDGDGKIVLAGTHAGGHRAALARFHSVDPVGGTPAPRAWPIIVQDVQAITVNSDGVLHIVGSDADDHIFIRSDGDIYPDSFATYVGRNGDYFNGLHSTLSEHGITRIVINGMGGNDLIEIQDWALLPVEVQGGLGNDTIRGSGANDTLSGNSGKDYLDGGGGDDRVAGNGGHDYLFGNLGNDRLYGDAGQDNIASGTGADRVYGGADGDLIGGGAGSDTLYGEAGADTISGGGGNDKAYDATSSDTLIGITTVSTTTTSFLSPQLLGAPLNVTTTTVDGEELDALEQLLQ